MSNRLVESLGKEERAKVELWANAYRHFIAAADDTDMTLELAVMQSNTTIPVFFTDENGNLEGYNNLEIPKDTTGFISKKIAELKDKGQYFEIELSKDWHQYLYYDESILLQQLHYYPYIQLAVIIVFAMLLYYMLLGYKQSEQNRVWVGLSKETAHQLGTPIQSLMGWMEILRSSDIDQDFVEEMDKDIQRLHTVAERFSKIGSDPILETTDLGALIEDVANYMQKRASSHITIDATLPAKKVECKVCAPLFAWVIENLCKNAIDAMPEGRGYIRLRLADCDDSHIAIEVEDNGKGIPKNRWKTIFQAGYSTKQRGWGLGLTLVKRIVEEYHHGKIYVKTSTVGLGTTFRIEL